MSVAAVAPDVEDGDLRAAAGGTPAGRGGVGVIVAATGVVSGLNYLYTLLMIWLLAPTQYAVVGSISALLLIWGTVASASVPWVLAREVATSRYDEARCQHAVSFATCATAAQAVGGAALTCLVAARYSTPPVLVAAFVSVVLIFGASLSGGYLQGKERFLLLGIVRSAEVAVKIVTGVLAVRAGAGSVGAVAGFAFGAAVVLATGLRYMSKDLRWNPGAVRDRLLWNDAVGLLSIQGGVAVMASIDVVLWSLTAGASRHLATYQAANIFGRVPLFVAGSVSIVFFPRMAAHPSGRPASIRTSLLLFTRVCIPAAVITATAPPAIVSRLFPHSYGDVASLLPWTAAAGLALGLVNLTTTYFQAAKVVRFPSCILGGGIGLAVATDSAGLHFAGGKGLAIGVALSSAAVAGLLLVDVHRRWPGSQESLLRPVLSTMLLMAPLVMVRSNLVAWLILAAVIGSASVLWGLRNAGRPARDLPARPRVLHLGYEDPRRPGAGGGSVRTHEINKRMADKYSITVVCAAFHGSRERVEDDVRYVHVGIGRGTWLSILTYFAAIPLALRRFDADLVVEDFGAPFSSVCVPWMTNRPVVGVVQWLFAREKYRQYKLPFHLVEQLGVRSHRQLIAVSDELAGTLARRNPRAEVVEVTNGLHPDAFKPRDQRRRGIAYLGRIEVAQKGLDLLITSFARIAGAVDHDLHIGGDGPDQADLELLARRLGIGDRVHFAGRIPAADRFEWLAGALLLAMPSRYESFGMVAAEALAVSTPVVAFDIPCLRQVVDTETAILVEPFDTEAYGAALLDLCEDSERRRGLGRAGPAKVARLDWDLLAERQGCLYGSAIHRLPFSAIDTPMISTGS